METVVKPKVTDVFEAPERLRTILTKLQAFAEPPISSTSTLQTPVVSLVVFPSIVFLHLMIWGGKRLILLQVISLRLT